MSRELFLYAVSVPFTSIFAISLGTFVLLKNSRNAVNVSWFITSLSVGAWAAFYWVQLFSASHALLFTKICNVAASFIPVTFSTFCYFITKSQVRSQKQIILLGYLSCFFIFLSSLTEYFLTVRPISIFTNYPQARPFYYYFSAHWLFYMIYAECILWKNARHLAKEQRNQIYLILLATSFSFISGTTAFLPVFDIPIDPYPTHFIWVYAAVVSYLIVKRGLMDIRIVLEKSLVYAFLIALITALYFSLVYLLGNVCGTILGYNSVPSVLFMVTLFAIGFKPLERKTQEFVDRLIFSKTRSMLLRENQLYLREMQNQDQMRAVATFAAGMAHEIKNPLTAIKIFTEELPKHRNDEAFLSRFRNIVGAEVDKIDGIVRRVLEFARPSQENRQTFSLNDSLNNVLDLAGSNLIKKGIKVKKNPYDSFEITGDQKQIQQVFLNLINNSIDAMPNGGEISISLRKEQSIGIVEISDTGCGISKENLTKIFDPFFTTKEHGTGLGLSIVHGILKNHDAEIEATSEQSRTSFRIRFNCSA